MKTTLRVAIASLALSAAVPLGAHHSWTADYDGGKPVTVKGVVTKVEWTNPHTHFYIEAKDEKGTVTMWNFVDGEHLAHFSVAADSEDTFGGAGIRSEVFADGPCLPGPSRVPSPPPTVRPCSSASRASRSFR